MAVASEPDVRRRLDPVGQLVDGIIEAVFPWGVIVDLNADLLGLIDVLYIDNHGDFVVGHAATAHLDGLDERKRRHILRPQGQIRVGDRLDAKHPSPGGDGI